MKSKIPQVYYQTVFELDRGATELPTSFAIVTAFNPMDVPTSPQANEAADRRLRESLIESGMEHFRATGSSPDRLHSEPGWAFLSSFDDAIELARRFNQRALWWIENDQLFLVNCENPELSHVARFSDRILSS